MPALSATRGADGCWGLALPSDPSARLARLGERCAQGFVPLFTEPRRLDDATVELALPPIADGACLRVAAVSTVTVALSVVGASGATLATDRDAAFALAPARGPLCPRGGGVVSVRLDRPAPGAAWVQAWASAP